MEQLEWHAMGYGEQWLPLLPAAGWDALGFVWNKVEMLCRRVGWDVGGEGKLSASPQLQQHCRLWRGGTAQPKVGKSFQPCLHMKAMQIPGRVQGQMLGEEGEQQCVME